MRWATERYNKRNDKRFISIFRQISINNNTILRYRFDLINNKQTKMFVLKTLKEPLSVPFNVIRERFIILAVW